MTVVLAIIGAVFTGAALWVGYQQMQMARVKLQHDLYERRSKVYSATRLFLANVLREVKVSHQGDLIPYWNATADAFFLLNDDIDKYLSSLAKLAVELEATRKRLEATPGDPSLSEKNQNQVLALEQNLNVVLRDRFRPFLAYPEIRTVPLWLERLWLRARAIARTWNSGGEGKSSS